MQEITLKDPFGQALAKYSEGLDFGVEIGGGTGDGSTQCIRTKKLSSFEVHPERIGRHWKNLSARPGGIPMHFLSSNPQLWMDDAAVLNFYNTTKTNLNAYSLDMVLGWLKDDLDIASRYKWEPKSPLFDVDFLLLDGGAFSGLADFTYWFPLVKYDGIIALDDINDIKNYCNYEWLKTSGHELIWENKDWRNGCAIFGK